MVRRAPTFPARAQIKTIPAPNGGLNARDGLAAMPETDAVVLTNWIPDAGGVHCRKGYSEWAINMPGNAAVGGILPYFSSTTSFPGGSFLITPTTMPGKLFASIDAGIYEITTTTSSPTLSQALSAAADAGWMNSTMFTNSAGTAYMLACSEADGYFTYDGTTWVKVTLGAGGTQVSVTDPTVFVQVLEWKSRAWFVVKNTTKAAYLPASAVYGAGAYFDFGPMFKHGGHLAYLANWTIDAGTGIDDLLVAVGSNGDVCVFKGTDPASASTFGLVGTWFVGQIPVGRRAFTQYGGDLVISSADGIFPISYVTRGGADFLVASSKEYSSKIRPLIGTDLRASFTQRGWQMLVHPSERVMLVNVPDYGSSQQLQYVMSTSLNQWCKFSGIPVYSLGFTAGYMFAGTTTGKVLLILNGPLDNVAFGAAPSSGTPIAGTIMPAFSHFGTPALEKQFLLVRPVFTGSAQPQISIDVAVNYKYSVPAGLLPVIVSAGSLWGVGLWGFGVWGGGTEVFAEWASTGDVGFAGAATLATLSTGDTVLAHIDYAFQSGNILG